MKNNWKKVAEKILEDETSIELQNFLDINKGILGNKIHKDHILDAILEFGNLVFEATKKECAEKASIDEVGLEYDDNSMVYDASISIDENSILNIEKPNL